MFSIERPENFHEFQGCSYSISDDITTWDNAQSIFYQLEKGYGLVIVHDKSEQDFLSTMVQDDTRQFWIELRELKAKSSYKWMDGSNLTYGSELKGDPWKKYTDGTQEPYGAIIKIFHIQKIQKLT